MHVEKESQTYRLFGKLGVGAICFYLYLLFIHLDAVCECKPWLMMYLDTHLINCFRGAE